ncbi:MAG: L,D-transpeptidase family protein [Methyloceanibacter sp.]|uniref:L,D-transpeptidase family protein n=1 Tax=Methyloceanibacter sp. TaxID=1965321 RepID=UPI003D6CC585
MLRSSFVTAVFTVSVVALAAALVGCGQFSPPYMKPLSAQTRALLAEKGMTEEQPVLIRIFKAESELEVWKQKDDGHYYHFKTYPICAYSGGLGPKLKQGDRQSPEGFYLVNFDQMNPKSSYYLAFDMGFPNSYDRAHERTGAHLMVHGDCTSSGCYAMTDAVVEEIYIIAREALAAGQASFQVQAYPFRMTAANMAAHRKHEWYDFWMNLKEGYDYFETTRLPPSVAVCEKRYLVNANFVGGTRPNPTGACPAYRKGPVVAFKPSPDSGNKNMSQASLAKPLGSVMGLSFGTIKPVYRAMTLGPATPPAGK